MKRLCVISKASMEAYFKKGEIKEKYYNPYNFFDEVHIITLADKDIDPIHIKGIAGKAKLFICPVGNVPLKKPFLFYSYVNRVMNLIKKINPDVLRVYEPHLAGFLITYIGKKLKIPRVISLHGNYDKDIRELSFKLRKYSSFVKYTILGMLFERYVIKNADIVICAYHFPVEFAKKKGARRIDVIYNRIDLKRFGKIKRKKPNDKVNILCVGRLDKEKNQEVLIRAIKDLDVTLTLIGDGVEYKRLLKLTKELGIEEKVKFIKAVPHKEIHKYYAQADIFAIGIKYGGVCIPVLEAMASSLPVVVPKPIWENKPEIVGEVAIVVENTPGRFKEAFQKLITNPKLREDLGLMGRKLIMEYDGRIMERKEMEVYKKLLDEGGEHV